MSLSPSSHPGSYPAPSCAPRSLKRALLTSCCLAAVSGCGPEAVDTAPAVTPESQDAVSVRQAERTYNPGAGWTKVWGDEFNGNDLNSDNWNVVTSNFDGVTGNCNFGTGELEYPRRANVSVGNGVLTLTAERTNDNPMDSRCSGAGGRSFYSGRIHSKNKVERKFGKLVASIKVPSGYGMWPAFWTMGANVDSVGWPRCGEIDIQEWNSTAPNWMKSAVHYWDAPNGHEGDWGTGADDGGALNDGDFHIYEVEWDASSIHFRVDGHAANDIFYHDQTELQQQHYIILNLAVGGIWYGNPSPASVDLPAGTKRTLQVEWIRWFQKG